MNITMLVFIYKYAEDLILVTVEKVEFQEIKDMIEHPIEI